MLQEKEAELEARSKQVILSVEEEEGANCLYQQPPPHSTTACRFEDFTVDIKLAPSPYYVKVSY